ncbi:MAG TPA: LPS export ABC transporter ATP-binding protein [Gemmata sp.]|jgi:lipopolysaccharide export system ATP-binding protein|nr:LPS export ABC transporter ATP-binding protein [Gemmata sp.]
MALLEVEGLIKYFGRRLVVDGVSFAVNAGEVVGLLGPNGAGKTTSFRMATGQIPPNGGRVTFNGEDVTPLPMYQRARRGMGYLSQEPSVFRKLTAEKNLLAILEALPKSRSLGRALTKAERWERTNAALKRFKLDHVRRNVAARCSGGEKRRLEIARCLVCEPLLILLDEPFAAVDPITTEDIRRNIRELADSGIGILVTDHNVREVFRTADRVYLITEGQVVTQGTPHELVNDEIAIKAYLGRSFEEDGFTRHFATRVARSASEILGAESTHANPSTETATLPHPDSHATSTNTPPPVGTLTGPIGGSTSAILKLEHLRQTVEKLSSDHTLRPAMIELVGSGEDSVLVLLETLERRESILRRRAFEVLKVVAKDAGPLDFDSDAPPDVRLRQVAYLRAKLERKR